MKIWVYAYRDKKLGCTGKPQFSNEDKEHTIQGTIRAVTKEAPADARDNALYFLGFYDDITMKFDLLAEPEKLLDLEDFISGKDDE